MASKYSEQVQNTPKGKSRQVDYWPQICGALPLIVRGMYRVGCLLIKLLIFVVDLPAKRSSFGRFQTDPTYTPLVHDAY
jgi:hypothetical protein